MKEEKGTMVVWGGGVVLNFWFWEFNLRRIGRAFTFVRFRLGSSLVDAASSKNSLRPQSQDLNGGGQVMKTHEKDFKQQLSSLVR